MQTPYALALAERLARGGRQIEADRRRRHADFVRMFRTDAGGFRGRDGDADLYYTSFAVRSLALCDLLSSEDGEAVAAFLSRHDPTALDAVDTMNWLATAVAIQATGGPDVVGANAASLADGVVASLATLRTGDGGFAKAPGGTSGSTYHTFLAVLAHQLVGRDVPRAEELAAFVLARQRDDGGFVEITPMRRSGTNPTAAACAVLQICGGGGRVHPDDLRDFFADVRTEGGVAANTRVPFPDGLSTFTALLTDQDWSLGVLHPPAVEGFLVEQLEFPTGGFRAAGWDDAADPEYTFYGLGCLALCRAERSSD